MIENIEQLEEMLSRPSDADRAAMAAMTGGLILLGAGGKMGPTLALRARRAAPDGIRVIAVSRFSDAEARAKLDAAGVETISVDLLAPGALESLPEAANVLWMSGRKFGSTGAEGLTWAMNTYLPGRVAERYRGSRIVAFSSGNVYPLVPVISGGASERVDPMPVGEYAQSALGRERMFQHFSEVHGTPVTILRLNYAIDLRYGVIHDIGRAVFDYMAVNVSMGNFNCIWQGDANSVALRAFAIAASPAVVLNLTGPETLCVRKVADQFGEWFGRDPRFEGREGDTALLNDAGRLHRLFGYPSVTPDEMIELTAHWIDRGGPSLNKPTHFEARDGRF